VDEFLAPKSKKIKISDEILKQLERKISQLKDKSDSLNGILTEAKKRKEELASDISNFHRSWQELRGKNDWQLGEFDPVEIFLRDKKINADDAETQMKAAEEAWKAYQRVNNIRQLQNDVEKADGKREKLKARGQEIYEARGTVDRTRLAQEKRTVRALQNGISSIFPRLHSNAMIDEIGSKDDNQILQFVARCGEVALDPENDLSHGQRQDLALSIFLSRAAALGGTFFIDDPITHLDDLNRVGLLDVFRSLVVQDDCRARFVVTTASWNFVRLINSKFRILPKSNEFPPIRIYELTGDPRSGQELEERHF